MNNLRNVELLCRTCNDWTEHQVDHSHVFQVPVDDRRYEMRDANIAWCLLVICSCVTCGSPYKIQSDYYDARIEGKRIRPEKQEDDTP